MSIFNIFKRKPEYRDSGGLLHCVVCGKIGLKLPQEIPDGKMDNAARMCVRCKALICVFCLKKLSRAPDGFGSLCPSCNQYSIFELSGKSAEQIKLLQKDAEKMYGSIRK